MLGRDLARALEGREVSVPDRTGLDLSDPDSIASAVEGFDVVINAAAFTQVDAAELEEDLAHQVNAVGPGRLAAATRAAGARLVHISTDYVFAGNASAPYAEDSPLDPVNAYGRSKAAGEILVRDATERLYLIRTAWLYGASGSNFARTIGRRLAAGEGVRVVDDQLGQPTWTADVAARVVAMLDAEAPFGIYHATNSGQASWFEFARAIAGELGADPALVQPTDSAGFPRPAARPAYSVLGHEGWARAGFEPLPAWDVALHAAAASGVLEFP
jgi:dTDP-4-dehydrorhamnose reductase